MDGSFVGLGLVDTGASTSILPREMFDLIEAEPEGWRLVHFADGNPVLLAAFAVEVRLLGRDVSGFVAAAPKRVLESLLSVQGDPIALLGRDLLNQVTFLFEGPNQSVTATT